MFATNSLKNTKLKTKQLLGDTQTVPSLKVTKCRHGNGNGKLTRVA